MKTIFGISRITTFAIWFMLGVSILLALYNPMAWTVVGMVIGYYLFLIYYFKYIFPYRKFKIRIAYGGYRIGEIICFGYREVKVLSITPINHGTAYELTVKPIKKINTNGNNK